MKFKKIAAGAAAVSILAASLLTGCSSENGVKENSIEKSSAVSGTYNTDTRAIPNIGSSLQTAQSKSEWSVYWYLCGSDLESQGGFATDDLIEALQVKLPEDVTVIVQTGGAKEWLNDRVDANRIQRWKVTYDSIELVDEQPLSDMGSAETLASFLKFASATYPAEKTAVVFWNHGGGSVSGVEFDEVYGYDSLTLSEIDKAFASVWGENNSEKPVELIGFDACLMATIDTAAMSSKYANYMVASEEVEPGHGWLYSGWLDSLAKNSKMDGRELGSAICESYIQGCVDNGTEGKATISAVDLSKVDALLNAYDVFGNDALVEAVSDSGFLAKFGAAARSSTNYGGNNSYDGYTNMVDLGSLAAQTEAYLPSAKDVRLALEQCVYARYNGMYRTGSHGLSCVYPYAASPEYLEQYKQEGESKPFQYLYTYSLYGELDAEGKQYISSLTDVDMGGKLDMSLDRWKNVTAKTNGHSYIELGPEAADILSMVGFSLGYFDTDLDLLITFGTDNELTCDWENGIFSENFDNKWGCLDGNPVCMILSDTTDEYELYAVPVQINGMDYILQVAYLFDSREWQILGGTKEITDKGAASKEMYQLKEGDRITILLYGGTMSDNNYDFMPSETIIYSKDTVFNRQSLGDGTFISAFTLQNCNGEELNVGKIYFEVKDGRITVENIES